jgi:hypothetical protein
MNQPTQLESELSLSIMVYGFPNAHGQHSELLKKDHISSFDVFVLPASAILEAFGMKEPSETGNGYVFNQAIEPLRTKLNEILEVCRAGASIIVPIKGVIGEIKTTYKGSISRFNLRSLPIFSLCSTTPLHGSKVQSVSDQPLIDEVAEFQVPYQVALTGPSLSPLLTTPSRLKQDEHVVAAYARPFEGGGVVVFCPFFGATREGYNPNYAEIVVYRKWIEATVQLSAQKPTPSVPAWAESLDLRAEHDARQEIATQRGLIQKAAAKIAAKEAELGKSSWQKLLFTATDEPLEDAVVRLFEEFGFRTSKGPKNFADVIAIKGDTIVCMEIKGYEGGVKDYVVGQCVKWISDVEHTLQVPADLRNDADDRYCAVLENLSVSTPAEKSFSLKGLIVANTHRLISLDKRPGPTSGFSDTQHGRMSPKGVAGITGVQLLGS